jgi:predicted DNA-binding transcriptional regulator AlpA
MQKFAPSRIAIYPKDIMTITGRSERTAYKLMADIKKKYNKQKGQFITLKEFCDFTGMKPEEVQECLR